MTETTEHTLYQRVDQALDDIRPHLQGDGGNIEIVEITEQHELRIRWMGTCESCNMSTMTMRAGVEQAVRAKVPEIIRVVAVNGLS
ncbi:MAG: NifU family protein [Saprospiraceae bacterium]|nr:NifU family protein [Saprospiraceae bacterium]